MSEGSITIVYDNRLHDKSLKSGWGFSCLVEHLGKSILFDTGDDPDKLSFNLKSLRIPLETIDAVVLSHSHWDHTGGLDAVIGKINSAKLYFGQSYPESFKQGLKEKGKEFVLVKDIEQVDEGIFAGPEMDGFGLSEIPLTVQTNKGLCVITGCAHPGISRMVKEVKKDLDKPVYMVLGGFHLGFSLRLNSIISEFKRLGVTKVGPCHCTGGRAISAFEENFKENFIRIGVGLKIKLDD